MEITYLGHSSFRIKTKTAVLVTDPYDASIGLSMSKVAADIVTVSHDHGDHNNISSVSGVKRVIDGPGEYDLMGVSILGFKTYHDKKKGAERGKNTIYVFEMEGIRLLHLGDLGHKLSQGLLDKLGDIDIVMVPVGGVYTIDGKAAVSVVQSIEPNLVIPMHYQVPGLDPKTFGELATNDKFTKDLGFPVENLDKLNIKAPAIDQEQKTIVLAQ